MKRYMSVLMAGFFMVIVACNKEDKGKEGSDFEPGIAVKYLEKENVINNSLMGSFEKHNSLFKNLHIPGLEIGCCQIDTIFDDFCASFSLGTDDDGYSYFNLYYGDEGCQQGSFLLKGKIEFRFKTDSGYFHTETIFTDFYINDVYLNGYEKRNFSGSLQQAMIDEEGDMVIKIEGDSMQRTSSFREEFEDKKLSVKEGSSQIVSFTNDYSYSDKIIEPVVYDFRCKQFYIPVAGIKEVTYEEGGETYTFRIDYGTGECDDIAEVTHDGNTYTIKFGDDLFDEMDIIDSLIVN